MLKKLKIVLSTIIASLIFAATATALEFQTDTTSGTDSNPVTLKFTFGETLNITTSGDIVITNLTPGTKGISSSNYKVSVSTNNQTGYTLSATIGCNSGTSYGTTCFDNTKLVDHNNNDITTNNFAMVPVTSNNNATPGTALTPGTWGVSLDSSIEEVGNDTTFIGLAKYNEVPTILNQTIDTSGTPAYSNPNSGVSYNGTNYTTVRIGAYATNSQLTGTYTNTINFIAIANTVPLSYIQDLTLSQCMANVGINGNEANIGDNITVVDRRDNNVYTVRYINGECWMTQNLRIMGAISATDSNFTGSDVNISVNDLATGNSYTEPRTHIGIDGSGNPTVWYNYCATSAGTICTESDATDATFDICPANWHLPTGPNTTANTDINKLVGNTTSGWQNPTTGLTAFSAVAGGYYLNGSLLSTGYGFWWSATANNTTHRYRLYYNSSTGQFFGNDHYNRHRGYFVRCVRSS